MKAPAGLPGGFFAAKARDVLNSSPNSFGPNQNTGGFDLLAWNINRGRDHGSPRKTISISLHILMTLYTIH